MVPPYDRVVRSQFSREWIAKTVSNLVLKSGSNRLADFDGEAIFEAPLLAVADGDDPLFEHFRQVVSPRHLLPREVLRQYSPAGTNLTRVSVIVWVLPFAEPIRISNRGRRWPSRLYSLARNNGGALNFELGRRLAIILRRRGKASVAPNLLEEYDVYSSPQHTFTSTWSQRHVAYAAGLGRFGLHGNLITPRGTCVRIGSIITNLDLESSYRENGSHKADCFKLRGEGCDLCRARCPVGAITRDDLDKEKCYAMRKAIRDRYLESYAADMDMRSAPIVKNGKITQGYSLGCALCQCGVPCEEHFPVFTSPTVF